MGKGLVNSLMDLNMMSTMGMLKQGMSKLGGESSFPLPLTHFHHLLPLLAIARPSQGCKE
jgi:hypothetical protein